jgi:dihydroflavonol-4-reductase
MSRVLVTGASGFVGANVVRALLAHGQEVRALLRDSSDPGNLAGLPVEVTRGDLRDAAAVRRAVKGCTRVFHVAADYRFWARDPAELYHSNVDGTVHVLEACLAEGVERVVHTSTVGTIGLLPPPALGDESTPLAPGQVRGHYKRSKLLAERAALALVPRGLPLVVVNPTAPVGPWDVKPTPTGKILVDFARGRMPAYVETGLNLVHVRDVAEGHWLAAERGRVGERYILGNRNMSLLEILQELSALTGRPAPRVRLPYAAAWVVGAASTALAAATRHPPAVPLEAVRMSHRSVFVNPRKAVEELGLTITPVRTALEDALAWFEERGRIPSRMHRKVEWASR